VPFATTSNELRLRINKKLYLSLCEMLEISRLRGNSRNLEVFASELLEATVAEFRLRKICATSPLASRSEPGPMQTNDIHKTLLSPGAIQRLLFLSAELNATELAARFGISDSHVRRILQRHESTEHVDAACRSRRRGSEWKMSF